ncbi:VOC family protein [Streptomyces sp. WMMC897]|uniref:VOC family protein n=1 Tax=Streptomyces sp. WMMC897 TaxID=3014782 RepID=UPI0022B6CABB|nr:VOC family protein [Streptomyces sp. WMMC897]MCZ7414931.1 VOC family protein [Streptomyces sp. WMMC897]
MEILGTTLRVCVNDLDAAVPVYERLTGAEGMRFANGPVEAAAVGPFILMSGPEAHIDVLRRITATLAVQNVEEAATELAAVGAEVVAGPQSTPIGRALVARHPDGSVFEYVDRSAGAA